jgi:aspartate 4-decarboxylase
MDIRTTDNQRAAGLEALSPFELKDELIKLAKDFTQGKAATEKFLNAGRGNPNWVATTPREAFLLLGQFALAECRRVWSEPDLGGMPHAHGIADRLRRFLDGAGSASEGASLLRRSLEQASSQWGFDADAFTHELVDSLIGDNYPVPDRMLVHAEKVVRRYLEREMCDGRPPPGTFDIFATEGGTAAMCYTFNSLITNFLLAPGDTIALGTPIFTPYLEVPRLPEFDFKVVHVEQSEIRDGVHTWQYPDSEIDKLADPRIKAFCLVNPSNPASFAMRPETVERLVKLVQTRRPDLMIVTDDVYGTFVPGFRSLMAELPRNTLTVYSYSKHFGCTGWRLGVIALHQDNVMDAMIARLPPDKQAKLHHRYESITPNPENLKFIDRMVADSRAVALNHTAGLSLPQQVQMTLFSLFALLDEDDSYRRRCREIVHERLLSLEKGMGVTLPQDHLRAAYYVDLDLEAWGRKTFGEEFMEFVKVHRDPLDVVFALAQRHGTVLLNGSGFGGPPWSLRVSLANLNADEYEEIGRDLADLVGNAISAWKSSGKRTHDAE